MYIMCVCIYIYIYIWYFTQHDAFITVTTELPAQWHSTTSHMWIYIYIYIYIYTHTHTHIWYFTTPRFHYSNNRTTCPVTQHHIPHEPSQKPQISQYRNWFMNLPSYTCQNHYQELQKDTHIYARMHPNK